MLCINVRPMHTRPPGKDPLGRQLFGWHRDMTPQQVYEGARGCWRLGPKADREKVALVTHGGVVRLAFTIDKLVDVPDHNPPRRAIEGRILGPGDAAHDRYVGKPSPGSASGSRNPISYASELSPCACGCGEETARVFVAGHDQRALHERVARIGTVEEFLAWVDERLPGPVALGGQ